MAGLELTRLNEPLFLSRDLEEAMERASRWSSLMLNPGQDGKSTKV